LKRTRWCHHPNHPADNRPSQCDPSENNECGVFRAIKRVYASFYNDNAFIERLRHGIDEKTTRKSNASQRMKTLSNKGVFRR